MDGGCWVERSSGWGCGRVSRRILASAWRKGSFSVLAQAGHAALFKLLDSCRCAQSELGGDLALAKRGYSGQAIAKSDDPLDPGREGEQGAVAEALGVESVEDRAFGVCCASIALDAEKQCFAGCCVEGVEAQVMHGHAVVLLSRV